MVLMTKHGLVKVATHALDRAKERTNLSLDSIVKTMRRALDKHLGSLEKKDNHSSTIDYGDMQLVLVAIGDYYKVVTVVAANSRSKSKEPRDVYIKGNKVKKKKGLAWH